MDWNWSINNWLRRVNHRLMDWGFPRDWHLVPLAALVGAAGGAAAHGYGQLMRLSERLFYGRFGGHVHIGLEWWLILLLPVAGALLVGLIKWAFGLPLFVHGVPEVMEAMARQKGRLSLRTGFFTALNSSLTIGSGGSAGQEGPIIHIGSVVGSFIGRILSVSREHLNTLVGCGAAAGIAAIFQAPVAGVLLVLEVILRDFSFRAFMPIVLASVVAVATSQALGGHDGALLVFYHQAGSYSFSLTEVLPSLTLGIVCGLVSLVFIKTLYGIEHWTRQRSWPLALNPVVGALLLGGMGLGMIQLFATQIPSYRPTFFGNGYPVIQAMLDPGSYAGAAGLTLAFLAMIGLCKLVGTSLTLGTGGAGGLFAPSLFIGAATGGAFGLAIHALMGPRFADPSAYALAGMAGVLSGTVHCPLTAMILVFEITRDYSVIMPVMLVAISSTLIAQWIKRESIYTQALGPMGIRARDLNQDTLLRQAYLSQMKLSAPVLVRPDLKMQEFLKLAADQPAFDYVVCDSSGRYLGMVVGEDLRAAILNQGAAPLLVVADLMRTNLPALSREDTLETAMEELGRFDVLTLAVVDGKKRVEGVVSRSALIRFVQETEQAQGWRT